MSYVKAAGTQAGAQERELLGATYACNNKLLTPFRLRVAYADGLSFTSGIKRNQSWTMALCRCALERPTKTSAYLYSGSIRLTDHSSLREYDVCGQLVHRRLQRLSDSPENSVNIVGRPHCAFQYPCRVKGTSSYVPLRD